jgi:3-oxoacyl-[acyl-carrier protein] reductase
MDLGLKGKTALVLGGGGGLGRAIAKSFAAEGARVAVAGVGSTSIDATLAELQSTDGSSSLSLLWDLADLSVIDANIARIESELGPVDILINNTGGPPPSTAAGQDPALWAKQFQAMVLSVIAITDRVLPGMQARGWGRILTSTSSGIIAPIPNLAISNALRMSLVGWSKTLAREVAKDGITANIVVPGRIATGRVAALDNARAKREGRSVEEVAAESAATIPVGRYGKPEEYADVVAFLASTRAAYITGAVIRVDGGMTTSI